jgi:RNA polymerase sigma-70 factor (ECF subfamily)
MNDLLDNARKGDADALAELCERYYPRILRYMRYRVNPATAEDLAGEVFVRVIREIETQDGSFKAWIYRIASNVVTDHYRYRNVRETEPMQMQVENPNATAPPVAIEREQDLRMAIDELTDDQEELILLKFIEGCSTR